MPFFDLFYPFLSRKRGVYTRLFSKRVVGRFILVLCGVLAFFTLFNFVRARRGQFALSPCAIRVLGPSRVSFFAFTFLCFFGPHSLWKWRTRVYGNGGHGSMEMADTGGHFFDLFGGVDVVRVPQCVP